MDLMISWAVYRKPCDPILLFMNNINMKCVFKNKISKKRIMYSKVEIDTVARLTAGVTLIICVVLSS